jgi:hypothetical protein
MFTATVTIVNDPHPALRVRLSLRERIEAKERSLT